MNDVGWDVLRLFAHVAREGSLAGAAARTGLSAPTLGRQMLALERALGRKLFVRRQTGYALAADGEALFERVRGMEIAARPIAEWREGVTQLPIVSLSAEDWMSRFIALQLPRLWSPADPFRLCLKTAEVRFDLEHRDADLALRDARPEAGNLAARRTVPVAYAAYCARGFDAVRDCNWIALGTDVATSPAARWTSDRPDRWITVWTDAPRLLHDLVRSGAGRAVLPCFVGDDDPDLVRAGPAIEALQHEAWIVAHDDERRRPEVRLVLDRLAGLLADHAGLFAGRLARTSG